MATIIKRKKTYSVVYRYTDANGDERQKWETFETMAEAKKRKKQVESQLEDQTFTPPQATTVRDLLAEYMGTYGVNRLAISTYSSKQGLINNYINPVIGDVKVQDLTPRAVDRYYQDLLKMRAVGAKQHSSGSEYVTPKMVKEIHKILRSAFSIAEKWEVVQRNPCNNATLPKVQKEERQIWDADTLFKAIDLCEDGDLKLALNLAFSCSLRMGEMLGLTWDCVEISDDSVEKGEAYIYINKELQRVNRDVLEKLGDKDIIFQFPQTIGGGSTVLVLKTPKTPTSVRKVFLPKTVAGMLLQRRMEQDELKSIMGSDYTDYKLVFAGVNGRPMEGSAINREMSKLIRDNDLPRVVFHSIRHTSITYKLKLSGGDVKAVQGDSGHAQASMVTEVYSHILDEGRQQNASLIEEVFYKKEDFTNLRNNFVPLGNKHQYMNDFRAIDKKTIDNGDNWSMSAGNTSDDSIEKDIATLMRLLRNPELADVVRSLVNEA